MPHTCSTLLVHCMDFRLEKGIHDDFLIPQNLSGDCDIVSVAGGAQALTQPDNPARKIVLDQITLSHALHGVSRVILMNHTDCGAYGGSAAFADSEREVQQHSVDLAEAKKTVLEKLPSLTVRTVLARIDGEHVTFVEANA